MLRTRTLFLVALTIQHSAIAADLEIVEIATKENEIVVTFKNSGRNDIVLLDKMELNWGVLTLSVKTENDNPVNPVTVSTDWMAFPAHRITIKPGTQISRSISVNLKPSKYKMSATYRVEKDSFFISNYFTTSEEELDPPMELRRKRMATVWLGTATSKTFELVIPESKKQDDDVKTTK